MKRSISHLSCCHSKLVAMTTLRINRNCYHDERITKTTSGVSIPFHVKILMPNVNLIHLKTTKLFICFFVAIVFKLLQSNSAISNTGSGHIKTRAAHSDQIYIHSCCAGIDVRTRGLLHKIGGKKCATCAASSFVRQFGGNFATNCLLFLVDPEKPFLLGRVSRRQVWQDSNRNWAHITQI